MYGASVAALTAYDMLKPLDKGIEIVQVRLLRSGAVRPSSEPTGSR